MNCEKHAKPSLEKVAKESECGPLHTPFNGPIVVGKLQKEETKKNQKHKRQKKTTNTNKTKKQHNHKTGQLDSEVL